MYLKDVILLLLMHYSVILSSDSNCLNKLLFYTEQNASYNLYILLFIINISLFNQTYVGYMSVWLASNSHLQVASKCIEDFINLNICLSTL